MRIVVGYLCLDRILYEGLAATFHIRCTWCLAKTVLQSSPYSKAGRCGARGKVTREVNVADEVATMTSGTGHRKIHRYLAALGVSVPKWDKRCSVGSTLVIESMKLAQETCRAALDEEIAATIEHCKDPEVEDIAIDINEFRCLVCGGDGCWQTRGSGHAYASFCGAFSIMGALTGKVVGFVVFDKMCAMCDHHAKFPDSPPHLCYKGSWSVHSGFNNAWTGSAKSMEIKGMEICVLDLGAMKIRMAKFVADEDSAMILAANDPAVIPLPYRPVGKLSDTGHMKKGEGVCIMCVVIICVVLLYVFNIIYTCRLLV